MKKRIFSLFLCLVILLTIPALPALAANPFVDVPTGSFFYEPVAWALANGITNGVDATHFGPNNTCMRAQVVTFLWRAVGEPEPTTTTNPFVDVKKSDFFYKPVLWAVENKITSGIDATHFGPTGNCLRAQVVTFMWRAAGQPEPSSISSPFVDVKSSDFYYKPVLWALENGITSGMDAAHFGPTGNCNRAQVVTFLYRAFSGNLPEIIGQPDDAYVDVGDNVSFTVTAAGGTKPYSYQWQLMIDGDESWINMSGDAASDTLSLLITEDFKHFGFSYRCIVTDAKGCKVTSRVAYVNINGPLAIMRHPEDVLLWKGDSATFSVEVYGGKAPYKYQWYFQGSPTWYDKIPDSNSRHLTIPAVNDFNLRYYCTITDAAGRQVTSGLASVIDQSALHITRQPEYVCAKVNDTVSFSVEVAGGTPPYTYQWYRSYDNGIMWNKLNGETGSTLIWNVGSDFSQTFRCVIRDAKGYSATSETAGIIKAQ